MKVSGRGREIGLSGNEKRDFDDIYREYHTMVYGLGLRYSDKNVSLAEDATQYAFMQLFRQLENGTEINNIATFMHTILKNHLFNCYNKTRKYELRDDVEPEREGMDYSVPSAETQYIEKMDRDYSSNMAHMILDELREKNEIWYIVVVEVFINGRSQSEVAKELEMNDTAMYATVRRIRSWANKHRIRFEQSASNALEEVSSDTSSS